MSRRSRRKKSGGREPWLGKALVAAGVVLLLVLTVGYAGLRAYLHSEGFRKFLSAEVSRVAKVKGEFTSFRWDGLAVETSRFEAQGEGMVSGLKAEQIATEVGFGGLGRGVWEIKGTRIARVEAELDFTRKKEPSPVEPEQLAAQVKKKQPGWVPTEVALDSLTLNELVVVARTFEGDVRASGMKVRLESDGPKGSHKGEIVNGRIKPAKDWLPEVRIDRVVGSIRNGAAYLTKADLKAWSMGRIHASGEWDSGTGTYGFEGDVQGVKCEEVLNETWSKRLIGDVFSDFSVSNRTGLMVMNGELEVQNGTLTALPVLDVLAAYADTRRFRVLPLSEARTKWRYSNGSYQFTDLVIASEGLVRLEGTLSIDGEKIDGNFRLGLVPGTLANIPGAETHVFVSGERGLLWAPFRLSGTLSDPKEDLTERLIAAAGLRMFEQIPETGVRVLKFTRNVVGEMPSGVIEKGIGTGKEVIEEGSKVIEGAGDLLRGVLGN